ncbi:MAG: hypothetical protein MMC33_009656 [Icmadophila ericetorum]|nr:hypothetical protein [Icmadophila ericetorum]
MDIYGTTVTAVTQIIQVTIFIKGVIADMKAYEADRATFWLKLDLQLASLEFFRHRFLDDKHGLLLPGQLPDWVAGTICRLLLKIGKVLVEYRALMAQYDLLDATAAPEQEKWKQSFLDRAKMKAKTLKSKADWALFDKDLLKSVLSECKEWTDSLRDLMQHFSQDAIYAIADRAAPVDSLGLKGTGLEPVVKRQKLASAQTPKDFHELEGEIDIAEGTASNRFQLASWNSTQVIVEYHDYDRRLRSSDLDPDELVELKMPVRNLAWLLQNSTFTEGDNDPNKSQQPTIYSLQCLGYKDQPDKQRTVFIYKLPTSSGTDASNLITLHELINKVDTRTKRSTKLPLGDRFNIASCLALTVLNVHGSLWLHKNIWSRGILLFQQNEENEGIRPLEVALVELRPKGKKRRILAFLGDWGYARPVEGATEMRSDFNIEPNLYRHPDRQGVPTRQFARPYDLYALGVVLLEVGLWRTVSQLFDSRIKDGQRTGKLPKPKEVCAALVSLAQVDLPKEMGEEYAAAVVMCLTGSFRSGSDIELSLDFREKVLDVISLGRKL